MEIKFTKYEGLGNDILIFDFPPDKLGLGRRKFCNFLRRVAHRNYGIGADEITFIKTLRGKKDLASITFFNSDGSRAEMCGNALRCIAKHLYEKGRSSGRKTFNLLTDAGSRECRVIPSASGPVHRVSVEMGTVRNLEGVEGPLDEVSLKLDGKTYRVMTASMGNPHVIFFGEFLIDEKQRIANILQGHDLFPNGVNVEFVVPKDRNAVNLIVWERGCGFTLACGSGACAAAAASVQKGACTFDRPIDVRLPGGVLQVTIARRGRKITMTGPARRIFRGALEEAES